MAHDTQGPAIPVQARRLGLNRHRIQVNAPLRQRGLQGLHLVAMLLQAAL